ncbi:MAG: hypothetical protein M3Z54_14950 [Gemmatimonadota bacterium]|nr:hypothetical protein [Gemmatimonadota bacterium]
MNLIVKDIAIVVVFVITGWMLKTYLTHREKMRGLSMTKDGLASSDERLARVEQAVESIAIEMERIGEGQRYVTKLLSESEQPLPAQRLATAVPEPMRVG